VFRNVNCVQRRCHSLRYCSISDRRVNVYDACAERYWEVPWRISRKQNQFHCNCPPKTQRGLAWDWTRAESSVKIDHPAKTKTGRPFNGVAVFSVRYVVNFRVPFKWTSVSKRWHNITDAMHSNGHKSPSGWRIKRVSASYGQTAVSNVTACYILLLTPKKNTDLVSGGSGVNQILTYYDQYPMYSS
jgi:hypothetical protein